MELEEANEIIAALRHEDNLDNLVFQDIELNGVYTKAICWSSVEDGKIVLRPMAVMCSPKLFNQINMIET